jgi:hypothetical protein
LERTINTIQNESAAEKQRHQPSSSAAVTVDAYEILNYEQGPDDNPENEH